MNNFFVLVTPDDLVIHSRVTNGEVDGISLLEKGDLPIRKDIFFNDYKSARAQLDVTQVHVLKYFPETAISKAVLGARVVKYHLTIIEVGAC